MPCGALHINNIPKNIPNKKPSNMRKSILNLISAGGRTLAVMATAIVCAFSLAACGGGDGDDDGDTGGGSGGGTSQVTANAGIVAPDGTRLYLRSVGGTSLSYSTEGRLTGIGNYSVSYGPFEITNKNGAEKERLYSITTNGKGYITGFKYDYSYKSSYVEETTTGSISFSYSSDGHLTAISGSEKATETENGETYSSKSSGKTTLTWTDGNLVSAATTSVSDGETETLTATYAYSSQAPANATVQYTPAYLRPFTEVYEPLFYTGYFGKAGTSHPTSASAETTEKDEDGKTYTDRSAYTFTTMLNSNGSVNSVRYKDDGYGANDVAFVYYPAGQFTESKSISQPAAPKKAGSIYSRIFGSVGK